MDIKRKKKEKRIQLFGGLIGVCVAVASLFYFFHAEKAEAEKRMVEIVNYVKVQCSTYTHFNESSESKSLLRAIESARQMSTNIKMEIENGGQLSRDFLKENLQTLWVDGIIVLDAEGKTDCEYSTDESLANEITEYLQKEIIMNFAGYEERSYSERFTREDTLKARKRIAVTHICVNESAKTVYRLVICKCVSFATIRIAICTFEN